MALKKNQSGISASEMGFCDASQGLRKAFRNLTKNIYLIKNFM